MSEQPGSSSDAGGQRPRYVLIETERAEADREAMAFRLNAFSPQYAAAWHNGLLYAISSLIDFPGPLSHAKDEDASEVFGYEVRRLLYFGPGRTRTRTPYRILFTILPSMPGDPERTVRVLRVLHGAQSILPLAAEE